MTKSLTLDDLENQSILQHELYKM